MLTVIDDKVGDHWFSIQCTKESYEFIGQPDHINCADLFDECLQPYHLSMRDLESALTFSMNAFSRIICLCEILRVTASSMSLCPTE
jgi:hypothetical protein